MARKSRTQGISFPPGMAEQVEKRAAALGLSRSAYIQTLIRADLQRRAKGETTLTVQEDPPKPPNPS